MGGYCCTYAGKKCEDMTETCGNGRVGLSETMKIAA